MRDRKNILFIITKSEIGGAQKFVSEQIKITSNCYNVYLASNKKGWLIDSVEANVKKTFLSKLIEKRFSVLYVLKLTKFCLQNNISLIITNSANAGLYGRLVGFCIRKKAIYYSHGWSSVYNGGKFAFILNYIEKILAVISTKVFCISKADYDTAINKIGVPINKLELVQNAILPMYKAKNKAINKNCIQLLSLTRFAHPKRIDLLIKSFQNLHNYQLTIYGDGDSFEYWNEYLTTNKISNIYLKGSNHAFTEFYDFDIFILLSESEGLPISAIEAMSAGLPLILSNVGGCAELIENNGFLVENNTQSTLTAIEAIIKNYTKFSENSKSFFNRKFNLSVRGGEYIKLYNNLI